MSLFSCGGIPSPWICSTSTLFSKGNGHKLLLGSLTWDGRKKLLHQEDNATLAQAARRGGGSPSLKDFRNWLERAMANLTVLATSFSEWAGGQGDLGGFFQPTSLYIYRQLNPALGFFSFFSIIKNKHLEMYLIFCLSGSSLTPLPSCSFGKRRGRKMAPLLPVVRSLQGITNTRSHRIRLCFLFQMVPGGEVHVNTELITVATNNCLPFLSTSSKFLIRQLVYGRHTEVY